MGGPFREGPYSQLGIGDFGPNSRYQIAVHHVGRAYIIGDRTDPMLLMLPARVQPVAGTIDVGIHGLPGRFVETINDPRFEISPLIVARLLESVGETRGTPLRLLTCHAAEPPMVGSTAAKQLATEWRGPVTGPNGLLRVLAGGRLRIDLVDWEPVPWEPSRMQIDPATIRVGQGAFALVGP